MTFAAAAAEWLRYVAEDRAVKPSTLRDYRSGLECHLLPAFAERRRALYPRRARVSRPATLGEPDVASHAKQQRRSVQVAKQAGRDTGNEGRRRHVAGDDRSGGDDCVVADSDAAEHNRADRARRSRRCGSVLP